METDKPLSVLLKFYPPAFFPQEYIFSALLDETDKVVHKITQWPSECTLRLRSDTILRLVMYTVDNDDATPGGTFFSQVYIPLERVIENGTSLSFCTLWLGCLEQNEHEFPVVEDVSKVNACFSESLRKGQDLLSPKVGVSVKIYDEDDTDRLAMFGIVDMYENAIAQLYSKVERAMTEKMVQMDKLDSNVSDRNAQINDIMEKYSKQLSGNETELTLLRTEKADDIMRMKEQMNEKDLKIEALSAEIHTLKLARRDVTRKLEKIKSGEEPLLVPESREDPTEIAKRAQQVAEKERQKTRGLEKELKKWKQKVRELEEKNQAPQTPVIQPVLASTRFQEEEVRKLQREVAHLSKAKIDAQRKKKQAETTIEQMKTKLADMTQLLDRQKTEAQRDMEMKTQRFFLNVRSIREEAKKYKEEVQLRQQSELSLQKELDTRKLENAQLEAAMNALRTRNSTPEHKVPEIQVRLEPEATSKPSSPMPASPPEAEAETETTRAPADASEVTESAELAVEAAEVSVASAPMGNGEAARSPSAAVPAPFPFVPRLSLAREVRTQSCERIRSAQNDGTESANHALNNRQDGHFGKTAHKIKGKPKSDKAHWQSINLTKNAQEKIKNAPGKENNTCSRAASLPMRRPPVPTRDSSVSATVALSKRHSERRSVPPRGSKERKRAPPSTCSFATSQGWPSSPDTIRDPNESLEMARQRSRDELHDVSHSRLSSPLSTPFFPLPSLANGNDMLGNHDPAWVATDALDHSGAVNEKVQVKRPAAPNSQQRNASVVLDCVGLGVDPPGPPRDALEHCPNDSETKSSAQCVVLEDALASPVEVHQSSAQISYTTTRKETDSLPTQNPRPSVQDLWIHPTQESKQPLVQDARRIDQRSSSQSLVRLDSPDQKEKTSTGAQEPSKLNAAPFQDPKHPLHNPFGVLWNSPHFGSLDTQPSAVKTANQLTASFPYLEAPLSYRLADTRTSHVHANHAQQRSPACLFPPGAWPAQSGTHAVQVSQRKSLPCTVAQPARSVLKPSSRATIGHGDFFSRFSGWGTGMLGDGTDQRMQNISRQQLGESPHAQFSVVEATQRKFY